MRTVGIRELKNHLSQYVRAAQSGERVTVTVRGSPVAELTPCAPKDLHPDDELVRLARAGRVRLGRSHDPEIYRSPGPWPTLSRAEVRDLLDWTRGNR